MTEHATKPFDPSRFLMLVSGKEYLEVKWRLVWFRSEFPAGRIETELVSYSPQEAVIKATVTAVRDGEILGVASDYGSETPGDFGDYLEKASTKAIGRALAALGFGTQFCGDHDFGATAGRVVDPPVQFAPHGQQRPPASINDDGEELASSNQMGAIYAIGKALGFDATEAGDFAESVIGTRETGNKNKPLITKQDASVLIEALNKEKQFRGVS